MKNNKPLNIHHSIQEMNGPLIEMTQTMHSKNHGLLHIWPNKTSRVHGRPDTTLRRETLPEINRPEFDRWRGEYWKVRAEQMIGGNQ